MHWLDNLSVQFMRHLLKSLKLRIKERAAFYFLFGVFLVEIMVPVKAEMKLKSPFSVSKKWIEMLFFKPIGLLHLTIVSHF